MDVKQVILSKNGEPLFPVTGSESVLFKHGAVQTTVEVVLNQKVDSATDELLITGTTISHANQISPSEKKQVYLLSFNSTGHIIESEPIKALNFTVGSKQLEYDGSVSKDVKFSDSFIIDNDMIELNWNEQNGDS